MAEYTGEPVVDNDDNIIPQQSTFWDRVFTTFIILFAIAGVVFSIAWAYFVLSETEITSTEYYEVQEWAKMPGAHAAIKIATADKKITRGEYEAIERAVDDTLREGRMVLINIEMEDAVKRSKEFQDELSNKKKMLKEAEAELKKQECLAGLATNC